MRIFHLIASRGFYGAENVVLQLAIAQSAAGHIVCIGLLHNSSLTGNPLTDLAVEHGISVIDLPCRRRIDGVRLFELRQYLEDGHFDVLHSHNYKSNSYGFIASRGLGMSVVSTCHNWTDTSFALRLYGRFDRWLLSHFDHIVSVAPGPAHRLTEAGIPIEKISIIENGVAISSETSSRTFQNNRLIQIGAVTRLSPEKGTDVLVRAAALCVQLEPPLRSNLRFAVLGDGPEHSSLAALIASLQLDDIFTLRGFSRDVSSFLAGLDIFVQPSRVDAMPMAVLEAMAAGLPVIASSLGQIPHLLDGGARGVLVAPDDENALANALVELAHDPVRRRRLGQASRGHVRACLSADVMARKYCAIYHRLNPALIPDARVAAI